ncbi:CMGC/SRPK protein kinase [Fusarium verticillioides 7600]|uniref:EKC/KEOPS complex subunit BUD32 n=1 Tax=Gibberella moniliformis (strain M3125 / FGSC 7600) TaxID=334819 RepID=W7MWV9_GIBM7|nr:CMGC/SRPK protein kinase [Fusarium verticillioides 7600]EWG52284.1 CMGC/SRPK protein kinase [Fusarium verticillioides 7600]
MTPSTDESISLASNVSDDSFRFETIQFVDTEEPKFYRKGGFHPVHIGDHFDGKRYRVVHKLGHGGFSVVWLAYDTWESNWVALKIVAALDSPLAQEKAVMCHSIISKMDEERFVTYKRFFHIKGPNGRHLCLVLPSCGPSCNTMSQDLQSRIRPRLARRVASQATKAIAHLHSQGLCHGDFTPSNMVFRIRNLDHLDDQGIYRLFGEPQRDPLRTISGEPTGAEAPRYVVGNLDFTSAEDLILDDICLIDYDQAFLSSSPPSKTLGTPSGFLAPEVAIGKPASPASDVWALGCSILQIRSGSSPFFIPNIDSPANMLGWVSEYLGCMPASWGEPLFDDDGLPTTDTTNGEPLGEVLENTRSLKQWITDIWDQPENLQELQSTLPAPERVKDENRPYLECYRDRFWKPAAIRIDDVYLGAYSDKVDKIVGSLLKISMQEVDLLYDLISKIFVYEPTQRVSARDILAHPWLHMHDTI